MFCWAAKSGGSVQCVRNKNEIPLRSVSVKLGVGDQLDMELGV